MNFNLPKPSFRTLLLIVIQVCAASAIVLGQNITRISPTTLTWHAVASSSARQMIAVGDSGRVMRSLNGGLYNSAFSPVTANIPDSVTLFAATYDLPTHAIVAGSSGWLSRSKNSGAAWVPVSLGTHRTIDALAENRAGVVIAAGDSGLLMRSIDFGATWTLLNSGTTKQLRAVAFGTAYAGVAVGNDTTILQTVDSGKTWNPLKFPYATLPAMVRHIDFAAVAMAGADSILLSPEMPELPLYIIRGHADPRGVDPDSTFRSHPNSGPVRGIVKVGTPNLDAWLVSGDDLVTYSALDSTIFPAAYRWKSYPAAHTFDADGGTDNASSRWSSGTVVRDDDTTIDLYLVGEYGRIGIRIPSSSSDSSSGIQPFSAGFGFGGTLNVLDIAFGDDGLGGCAVGAPSFLELTSDGGSSFYRTILEGNGVLNSVASRGNNVVIACGFAGLIDRLLNGGADQSSPDSHTLERLHGVVFQTTSNAVIVGDFGYISRSTDTGKNWQVIESGTSEFLKSVAFMDSSIGVTGGTNGTILRTTDGGLSWNGVNSVISGTPAVVRRIQALPEGSILAQASDALIESKDKGKTWEFLKCPGDSLGMSFFNRQIGIVATRATSSRLMLDTVLLSFTTNGGITWQPVTVPIANGNRLVFHWRNDHQVLLYGIEGWIVQLDIAERSVKPIEAKRPIQLHVYPNPTRGDCRIEYTMTQAGPVLLELWDAGGKSVSQLLSEKEAQGAHSHAFSFSGYGPGTYFLRLSQDGTTSIVPISVE